MRKYLILLVLFLGQVEGQETPTEISLGTVRTELEAAAIRAAVKHIDDMGFNVVNQLDPKLPLKLSKELQIDTGDKDSFKSARFKLRADYYAVRFGDYKDPSGVVIPNVALTGDGIWAVVPVALGIEANRNFSNVNGVLEIGLVPFYTPDNDSIKYKLGINPMIGFSYQLGRKFSRATAEVPAAGGGDTDQSKEAADATISRFKVELARFEFSPFAREEFGKFLWSGAYWRDLKNRTSYRNWKSVFRIPIGQKKYWEVVHETGSGAPDFNKGSQVSANLAFQLQ